MQQLVDYRKEYHIAADQGIPTTSTTRPSSSTTTPSPSNTPTIPSTSPVSSTTDYSTVPPQRRCSQLCDGAGDGETVGDCCGEHFCYCTTSGMLYHHTVGVSVNITSFSLSRCLQGGVPHWAGVLSPAAGLSARLLLSLSPGGLLSPTRSNGGHSGLIYSTA